MTTQPQDTVPEDVHTRDLGDLHERFFEALREWYGTTELHRLMTRRLRPALGDDAYDEAFAAGEAAPDEVVRAVLASRAAVAAPVAGENVRPGG